MKSKWLKIILWFGIMAVLTVLVMGLWMIVSGGSQTTESLKWLQFMQTIAAFLLPSLICAWVWDEHHQPMAWLKMDRGADWQLCLLAISIMVFAIPGINLLADLNSHVKLPDSLDFIEQKLKAYEDSAAQLTVRFLKADNIGEMMLNIGLMALLPALAEEISFRGTLLQILKKEEREKTQSNRIHWAIWLTAFIFSAIHLQFYGFIPRMLLGAMFGYIFVWSGTLWIPVLMHFINNGLAVVVYYITDSDGIGENSTNIADTIGAGDTWYLGVLSLLITSLGLLIFYRKTRTR